MSAPAPGGIHEHPELRRSLARWQWAGVIVFVLLVAAFPLYKAVESTRRDQAFRSQAVALVTSGRHLWRLNCASCHGDSGQGVDAPALRSKQFLEGVTDEQMHRVVSAGITGTEMPSWSNEFGGPLTDQEIQGVVAYVRSWQPKAPSVPDWRSPGQASPTP